LRYLGDQGWRRRSAKVHRWLADDPAYNSYLLEMVYAVGHEVRFLETATVNAIRFVLTDEAAPASVEG
jgi:hypothetical protein